MTGRGLTGFLLFLSVLLCCPCARAADGLSLRTLDADLSFAPPHNEPVLPVTVARYGLRFFHRLDWRRLEWEGENIVWGTQKWRTGIGCHFEGWEDSSWDIQNVPISFTNRLTLRVAGPVALLAENHQIRYVYGNGRPYDTRRHNLFGLRIRVR